MTISPLADRDSAFTVLADAWDQVRRTGRTRAIIVSGDSGCGKSRLVAESLAALNIPDSSIVLGCASRGTPAPYDWLANALTRSRPTPHRPSTVDPDAFAWLTHSRQVPHDRVEPTALRRAARHMVMELLGGNTGVVIVEDLHRLDPASAELVAEIADDKEVAMLLLLPTRPVDAPQYPKSSRKLCKSLQDSLDATVLELENRRGGSPGGAVWARYARRLGAYPEAAAGALRAAADLVSRGDTATAADLLDEFLPNDGGPRPDTEPVLASAAAHLRGRAETCRQSTSDDASLTEREHEVVGCLAAGMSNRQIARRLGISVRTVTVHVSNLLRKTQTGSRTEAALWAVEHGLGPSEDAR